MQTWDSKISSPFEGTRSASWLSFIHRRKWQHTFEWESRSNPLSNCIPWPPNHSPRQREKPGNVRLSDQPRLLISKPLTLSQDLQCLFYSETSYICEVFLRLLGIWEDLVYLFIWTKLSKGRFPLWGKHFSHNIILVLLKRYTLGAPGWFSPLNVRLLVSTQVTNSQFVGSSTTLDRTEPA